MNFQDCFITLIKVLSIKHIIRLLKGIFKEAGLFSVRYSITFIFSIRQFWKEITAGYVYKLNLKPPVKEFWLTFKFCDFKLIESKLPEALLILDDNYTQLTNIQLYGRCLTTGLFLLDVFLMLILTIFLHFNNSDFSSCYLKCNFKIRNLHKPSIWTKSMTASWCENIHSSPL